MPRSAEPTFDVAVVGAGPAGVAAAVVAGESGATVVVLDAGARPGGQYYRRPAGALPDDLRPAHHAWHGFDELEARLAALVSTRVVDLRHDTTVWSATGAGPFRLLLRGSDREPSLGDVSARTVVLATGAYDRQVPFPGWDLPGVLGGGGLQATVKGSGVLPGRRVVVAGTGPFLLPVAATVLEAGGEVAAVVEANDPTGLLRHAPALLPAWARGRDLARFVGVLAQHRVPYLRRHRVVEAVGVDRLEAVTVAAVDREWRRVGDAVRRYSCDVLAVGVGFTAQHELALQLGCTTVRSADGGLAVAVDGGQRTTVQGVLAAGETTGVGGADLALAEGLVAGASAAQAVGRDARLAGRGLASARRRVRRLRGYADALHAAFPVRDGWFDDVRDDTLVCRCEEVPMSAVREAVDDLGASDARTVKLLTRAGMGWCQGRICGHAVELACTRLTGEQVDPDASAAAARRPLAAPVRLGDLAALDGLDGGRS